MMINRAFVLAAYSTLAVAANANLVNNGSFEVGNYTGGTFQTLGANSSVITNWIADDVEWVFTYWTAQQGSKSVDLNASISGSIRQTFATVPGEVYNVEFYVSGNYAGLPALKSYSASVDGAVFVDTFDTAGISGTNMNWTKRSFTFLADDSQATLKFSSTTPGPFGAVIDNVSVQAVPEPASLAVVSIGLLALKRRRSGK